MLEFLLYTVFFLIFNAAFAKVAYISIQPDQWFDRLFKWQNKIALWGARSNGFWDEYRYKSWGGCEVCFSREMAFIGFAIYAFSMNSIFDLWINTSESIIMNIVYNVIWFIVYGCTANIINLYAITKLFK